jgi:hypothetical protein
MRKGALLVVVLFLAVVLSGYADKPKQPAWIKSVECPKRKTCKVWHLDAAVDSKPPVFCLAGDPCRAWSEVSPQAHKPGTRGQTWCFADPKGGKPGRMLALDPDDRRTVMVVIDDECHGPPRID